MNTLTVKDMVKEIVKLDKVVEEKKVVKKKVAKSLVKTKRSERSEQLDFICKISNKLGNNTIEALADEREEINKVLTAIEKITGGVQTKTVQDLKKNIRSIVFVVQEKDLIEKKTIYEIKSKDLGKKELVVAAKKYGFSTSLNKKIRDQRSANGLGTGWLYTTGKKCYVITAAHVIFPIFRNIALKDIRFVRGYSVREGHLFDRRVTIEKSALYKPVGNTLEFNKDYNLSSGNEDWAIIEVEAENGKAIEGCLKESDILDKDSLTKGEFSDHAYCIGHGWGMPLKFSPNGEILTKDPNFLNCKIDTFSGNSGSPLFDAHSHQLIGMLVRGQKDVYFKNGEKKLTPGVLSKHNKGETFQVINFLDQLKTQNQSEDLVAKPTALAQIELIPFTSLIKKENGDYQLYIHFANDKRKVTFPAYPKKIGDITVIECYLDKKERDNSTSKKFVIEKPSKKSETIELRVYDKLTKVFHISTLDYNNHTAFDANNIIDKDKTKELYWASCLTKEAYEEANLGKDLVWISLGCFDGKFVRTDLNKFVVKDIKNSEIFLDEKNLDENDNPILTEDKPNNDEQKSITFSDDSTVGSFDIRKDGSSGGRDKLTGFIDPTDIA